MGSSVSGICVVGLAIAEQHLHKPFPAPQLVIVTFAQEWLRKKGSPHSRIERAEFTNERTLEGLEFDAFSTERL